MSGIIDPIYSFCCFLITEIGLLLGLSYEAINVLAFCFIEPIFTGLMIILAILALCRVHVRIIGTALFWSVVGSAAIIFAVGSVLVIGETFDYSSSIEQQIHMVSAKETNPIIIDHYNSGIHWLRMTADELHTTYHVVNIFLYTITLPFIILLSYIMIRVHKQRKQ